jgi:hypothetical protein
MNSGRRGIVFHVVLAFSLTLPALAFASGSAAQSQRPSYPAGAPHPWPGKPGGTPPQGAPSQSVPPVAAPAATIRPAPAGAPAPGKATVAGEKFFIVASVDLQKSQLLLKYPTEVTLLVVVNNATKFTDDTGKPLKLSDFRSGDTVWMVSSSSGQGEATALRVRKGRMTVADLHRYYLDYEEIK